MLIVKIPDPEKLDPLDLLPLPLLLPLLLPLPLDDEPDDSPVSEVEADPDTSLCVHAPSATYVFVPGTWIATVRALASMRSSVSTRSSPRRP